MNKCSLTSNLACCGSPLKGDTVCDDWSLGYFRFNFALDDESAAPSSTPTTSTSCAHLSVSGGLVQANLKSGKRVQKSRKAKSLVFCRRLGENLQNTTKLSKPEEAGASSATTDALQLKRRLPKLAQNLSCFVHSSFPLFGVRCTESKILIQEGALQQDSNK